jgi:hypothetical protein
MSMNPGATKSPEAYMTFAFEEEILLIREILSPLISRSDLNQGFPAPSSIVPFLMTKPGIATPEIASGHWEAIKEYALNPHVLAQPTETWMTGSICLEICRRVTARCRLFCFI